MTTGPSGPLLICYDGSEDGRYAIERAGDLLRNRPALVLTAWQPVAGLGSFAWLGVTTSMVNFVELDRAAAEDAGRVAAEGVRTAKVGRPGGRAGRDRGHSTYLGDDPRGRRPRR
jgi:hypothetical protein